MIKDHASSTMTHDSLLKQAAVKASSLSPNDARNSHMKRRLSEFFKKKITEHRSEIRRKSQMKKENDRFQVSQENTSS